MNIAILGTGNVGAALGQAWAKAGHHVIFGSRDASSADLRKLVADCGANASAATIAEAVKGGEVVVLALPWPAVKSVVGSLNLEGKIVFDCTNPLMAGLAGLEIGTTTSAGEQIERLASGASVVKIFNTTGSNNMADPKYGDGAATMLFCGNDAHAKSVAAKLAAAAGFEPQDAGPIENARLLEPLAMLWIWLAHKGGLGRDIAFRLVKR